MVQIVPSTWEMLSKHPTTFFKGIKTFFYLFTGENVVLRASYRRVSKNTRMFTALLPFFGTDYGIWDERERESGIIPRHINNDHSARIVQRSAKGWSLGCVNSPPATRGSQDAGFTQPRVHSLAHPCRVYAHAISIFRSCRKVGERGFNSNDGPRIR